MISQKKDLPPKWVLASLEDISTKITDGTHKTPSYLEKGVPFISTSNLNPFNKEFLFNDYEKYISINEHNELTKRCKPERGNLLVSKCGTIGRTQVVNVDYDFSIFVGLALIKINKNYVSPKYLEYLLNSPQIQKEMIELSPGTGRKTLTLKALKTIKIPIAPFAEQGRIVNKLEELFTRFDNGMQQLQKAQAQLKRYKQSILKKAFQGNFIKNHTLKQLKVGDIADKIHYGYTASASNEVIGPKFLRITDIQNGQVNWDTVPFCEIENEKINRYKLQEGDLLFARTGATVGKSYLIPSGIPDTVFASYLIRIILKEQVFKKYVYYYFQSSDYWLQISQGQLGIGQPNVNAQILSKITIPIPSYEDQIKITQIIENNMSIIEKIENDIISINKQIRVMKNLILKTAFNGKLVPQSDLDESASILLELIHREKGGLKLKIGEAEGG